MTSLIGRRIHIAGSVSKDVLEATPERIVVAREFVAELVKAFLKEGATFVVPIDCEPLRQEDQQPLLFDWLVLETLRDHLHLRPRAAVVDPKPLIVAVQHHKNNEQIPHDKCGVWNDLNDHDGLVYIENAGHWNMASKRMDLQATHGDVLIALGGDEGVLYLGNLYRDTGKPVIPLNFPIVRQDKGARRLFNQALISSLTHRFFRLADSSSAHAKINRVNFREVTPVSKRVEEVLSLVQALRRPTAFAVRLLNPEMPDFQAVEDHFEAVIKPVVESMGYELVTIDGGKAEYSIINLEIFENLHRANVVVVDVTGERPNCFIELGYALGRGLPVMVTARDGTNLPFDTAPVPTRKWKSEESVAKRKTEFKQYWEANAQRRRIVESDPLVH
jgi:hypothetical protein